MIEIRPLTLEDIPSIIKIHLLSFPESALSALGAGTIYRYYHWLLTGPHDAFIIGIWEKGSLAGFSFGGRFRGALSGFIKKNKWYLMGQVIFRPWIILKFQEAIDINLRILRLKRSSKIDEFAAQEQPSQKKHIPSFGILAIAVNSKYQGKGFGQKMMKRSEESALERGFKQMNLTVHPDNKQAVGFYKKLGWKQWEGQSGIWKGKMVKAL